VERCVQQRTGGIAIKKKAQYIRWEGRSARVLVEAEGYLMV